jgi:hypothetical protein
VGAYAGGWGFWAASGYWVVELRVNDLEMMVSAEPDFGKILRISVRSRSGPATEANGAAVQS